MNPLLVEVRARRALGMARRRRPMPRQREPLAIKASYYSALKAITLDAKALVGHYLVSQLPALVREAQHERGDALRQDAVGKKAKEAIEAASKEFERRHPAAELERLAGRMATQTSGFHKQQLDRQLNAALGIDVLAAEPRIRPRIEQFAERNVSLITGSVLRPYFHEIEARTLQSLSTGDRWEDIAEELEERYSISEGRARLIARDQVGKLYGQLNQARQEALGISSYVWRTMQDGSVRDEHAEREGKTFDWKEPPEDGNPGEPILCRCWAEPNLDGVLGEASTRRTERFSREKTYMRSIKELEDIPAVAWNPSRTPDIIKGFMSGAELPPIRVAAGPDGIRELVDGNHRLWVARQLGVKEIPVRFESRAAFERKARSKAGPSHLQKTAEENWRQWELEGRDVSLWKKLR